MTNNRSRTASGIVRSGNDRCNQENLIKQLKGRGLCPAGAGGQSGENWACTLMASLAWTLKAWFALLLPEQDGWK